VSTPAGFSSRASITDNHLRCLTCRERKVRCDGKRPGCSNCTRAGRTCKGYERTTDVEVLLRHRDKDDAPDRTSLEQLAIKSGLKIEYIKSWFKYRRSLANENIQMPKIDGIYYCESCPQTYKTVGRFLLHRKKHETREENTPSKSIVQATASRVSEDVRPQLDDVGDYQDTTMSFTECLYQGGTGREYHDEGALLL
jgi:hypothetical protein